MSIKDAKNVEDCWLIGFEDGIKFIIKFLGISNSETLSSFIPITGQSLSNPFKCIHGISGNCEKCIMESIKECDHSFTYDALNNQKRCLKCGIFPK